MSERVEFQDQPNSMRRAIVSPSPLNGERVGVRGGNVSRLGQLGKSKDVVTPPPQSLSPLSGEEGLLQVLQTSSDHSVAPAALCARRL